MAARAVIFDLDGTLLDSLEDLADSMNAVLLRSGLPTHPLDAYRYFVGEGIEMLVQRAVPEAERAPARLAAHVGAMRSEYDLRSAAKTRPYPGVPELLDALEARGMPAAILSNKPHDATVEIVTQLLGKWRFRAVLGARPSVPKKPDPAGALEIAAGLGVPPGEILYLGDTATDMRTARAALMRAVGALWGFRTEDELREAGAEFLARDPGDLLDLLP